MAFSSSKISALQGSDGSDGAAGAAAGFGTPAANASNVAVDGSGDSQDATISVTPSGPDTAKIFTFALGIPVGSTGATGATGTVDVDTSYTWTKAQIPSTRTAAFEQPNFDTYQNFIFTLSSGTNAFTEPSTEASNVGQTGVIVLIQPSGGDGVVTWHTDYKPVGGTVADLSDSNAAVDILPYCIQADNNILIGAPQLNLKATS